VLYTMLNNFFTHLNRIFRSIAQGYKLVQPKPTTSKGNFFSALPFPPAWISTWWHHPA
jgi:hypothetical protein